MNKDQALQQISELFAEIRADLEASGMSPNLCTYTKDRQVEASLAELDEAYKWMLGFRAGYVNKYKEIIALVPELVWGLYALEGKIKTYEERTRLTMKKVMYDKWKARPYLLKKGKVENEQAG